MHTFLILGPYTPCWAASRSDAFHTLCGLWLLTPGSPAIPMPFSPYLDSDTLNQALLSFPYPHWWLHCSWALIHHLGSPAMTRAMFILLRLQLPSSGHNTLSNPSSFLLTSVHTHTHTHIYNTHTYITHTHIQHTHTVLGYDSLCQAASLGAWPLCSALGHRGSPTLNPSR